MRPFLVLSVRNPEHLALLPAVQGQPLTERYLPNLSGLLSRPDLIILTAEHPSAVEDDIAACRTVMLCQFAYTHTGARVDAQKFADQWEAEGLAVTRAVSAPFGALRWRRRGAANAADVIADAHGLGQIFYYQGDGWCAASSSALFLGKYAGADANELGLGVLALTGSFYGSDTAHKGVFKLAPGCQLSLAAGSLEIVAPRRTDDVGRPQPRSSLTLWQAAAEGAHLIREAVAASLEAVGDEHVVLELSGGLDSRLLLAGIPRAALQRLSLVTIGAANESDVVIATTIAKMVGLQRQQRLIHTGALTLGSGGDALRLAVASGRKRNFSTSSVGSAVLDRCEGLIGSAPRINGQNGEFSRGFYYRGQLASRRPHQWQVRQLVNWRWMTNDVVELGLLDSDLVQEARASLYERIFQDIASYNMPWLEATDELYLAQRMQRWAGAELSVASAERAVLAPFFHLPLISWSRSIPPSLKGSSRLMSAVLCQLDAALAELPLAGHPSPASSASPLRAQFLTRSAHAGATLARKLNQRLRRQPRRSAPEAALAQEVLRQLRLEPSYIELVSRHGFVNERILDEIRGGTRDVQAPSVSLMLLLAELRR